VAKLEDWIGAYLSQAQADLAAARRLLGQPSDREYYSVFAMLMQMTYEKIGKAALLRMNLSSLAEVRRTHAAAVKLLEILEIYPELPGALQYFDHHTGHATILRARDIIRELESANPSVARGQDRDDNILEYPWEKKGKVLYPERDLPVAKKLRVGSGLCRELVDLAERLIRSFDSVFFV
jgi:hypothetical protein